MDSHFPCTGCFKLVPTVIYEKNLGRCNDCCEGEVSEEFFLGYNDDEIDDSVAMQYRRKGAFVDFELGSTTRIVDIDFEDSDVEDFSALPEFKHLLYVNFTGIDFDFKILSKLPKLEKINLSDTSITDLSLISSKKLQKIYLEGTPVTDLSPLASKKALEVIELSGTSVTDLSPLYKLPIRYLDISNTKIDFNDLCNFPGLEDLITSAVPADSILKKVSSFGIKKALIDSDEIFRINKKFPGILRFEEDSEAEIQRSIDMDNEQEEFQDILNWVAEQGGTYDWTVERAVSLNDPMFTDLTPLTKLKNLESLNIKGTGVDDLEMIKDMVSLKYLNISGCPVSDLSAISDLKSLKVLDISRTKVRDIAPLASLRHLSELDMSATPVTALGPLENLSLLTSLDLSHSEVFDIDALTSLPQLSSLYLSSLKDDYLDVLQIMTNVKQLYFSYVDGRKAHLLALLKHLQLLSFSCSYISEETLSFLREEMTDSEIMAWNPEADNTGDSMKYLEPGKESEALADQIDVMRAWLDGGMLSLAVPKDSGFVFSKNFEETWVLLLTDIFHHISDALSKGSGSSKAVEVAEMKRSLVDSIKAHREARCGDISIQNNNANLQLKHRNKDSVEIIRVLLTGGKIRVIILVGMWEAIGEAQVWGNILYDLLDIIASCHPDKPPGIVSKMKDMLVESLDKPLPDSYDSFEVQ